MVVQTGENLKERKNPIIFPRLGKTQCYGLELAYLRETML